MLILFFRTITEPFPQPWNLLNQCASKNELLDDTYHLGYVSDILLISTYTAFAECLQKGMVRLSLLLLSLSFWLYREVKWDCPFTSVMLFALWIGKASLFALLIGMTSVSVVTDLALQFSQRGRSWGAKCIWIIEKAKFPTTSPFFSSISNVKSLSPSCLANWMVVFVKLRDRGWLAD